MPIYCDILGNIARSTVRDYMVALNIYGQKFTEQATVLAEANTEAMRWKKMEDDLGKANNNRNE